MYGTLLESIQALCKRAEEVHLTSDETDALLNNGIARMAKFFFFFFAGPPGTSPADTQAIAMFNGTVTLNFGSFAGSGSFSRRRL